MSSASAADSTQVSPDGSSLYFASARSGVLDLYRASRGAGGVFGTPQPIGELNTPAIEADPVLTSDELIIYFTRSDNIYVSRRTTKLDGLVFPCQ
ncbi:MAG: hypothetical protein E6J90_13965 [Deltaproteobacteria bacterium]|nr:MAG: hypothetical protein E6J90_13965 [Deltaproteobacteria bacterium]